MELIKILQSFAYEKGVIIGMCDARTLDSTSVLSAPPFFRHGRGQISSPQDLLPGARSIIVIGAGCNRELCFERDDVPRGVFSLGAVGLDYHISVRALLNELEEYLRVLGFVFDCLVSVDTGPLSEKHLAVKSGLGFIGKNGLVISEKFGSFFNIGCMMTTIDFSESDYYTESDCGECNRCVRACPAGALDGIGVYDYKKCISYLTQKKGGLSEGERKLTGRSLYGCDICQRACPLNNNTYVGKIETIDIIMPKLRDILALTSSGFAEKYKSTAIYWRGLANLKRNAEYALENIEDGIQFP